MVAKQPQGGWSRAKGLSGYQRDAVGSVQGDGEGWQRLKGARRLLRVGVEAGAVQ